jgi:putative DNA primase/helicase
MQPATNDTASSHQPARDAAQAAPPIRTLGQLLRDEALLEYFGFGPLRFDVFHWRPCAGDRPLRVEDADALCEKLAGHPLGAGLKGGLTPEGMRRTIALVARQRPFHPIADEVCALRWNKEPLLDRVAGEILKARGASAALWGRLVRRWIIGALARALEPGRPMDPMLVLVGVDGASAARFFRTLFGAGRVLDAPDALGSAGLREQLRSAWVCVWPDFASFHNVRQANAFAAFSSRERDHVSHPFAWRDEAAARTTVFASSVEQLAGFPEGALQGRCWFVPAGEIDYALLAQWRDQLLAEACAAVVEMGEEPVLDAQEEPLLRSAQQELGTVDPAEDAVLKLMAKQHHRATMDTVLWAVFGTRWGGATMALQHRVGRLLRHNGYVSVRRIVDGTQQTVWERPAVPAAAGKTGG